MALLCGAVSSDFTCPTQVDGIFADMHDGDQKGTACGAVFCVLMPKTTP
jgi:hypothetical protein